MAIAETAGFESDCAKQLIATGLAERISHWARTGSACDTGHRES